MRYMVHEVWQKYSISPLEWEKVDKQIQLEMISKVMLDNERESRIRQQMNENR